MRKRSTRTKPLPADLASPVPTAAATPSKSGTDSPEDLEFNFRKRNSLSSAINKKKNAGGVAPSILFVPPSSPPKGVYTISDLKDLTASRLDSIKLQLERSQAEIMKEVDASQSRLQKKLKMQSQGCQQVMDEAERECKKMSDRLGDSQEAMKASFTEFIEEAQACATHLCETTIPKISQSFEKSINALRAHIMESPEFLLNVW